jgi:hypothetical protein
MGSLILAIFAAAAAATLLAWIFGDNDFDPWKL